MANKRKREVTVGVRMPEDLRAWAKGVAEAQDLTLSQVVRKALGEARVFWGDGKATPSAARKTGAL